MLEICSRLVSPISLPAAQRDQLLNANLVRSVSDLHIAANCASDGAGGSDYSV